MNQTEQATSVTGADIDAAIQDEHMIELERQINILYAEAARQAERIVELVERVARDRTQVVADAAAIHVVGSAIYDLQQEVMKQAQHIERLEAVLKNWLNEPIAIPLFGLAFDWDDDEAG